MTSLRRSAFAVFTALAVSAVPMAAAHAAGTPVPGRFCAKKDSGNTATYQGKKIKCEKNGSSYQWKAK
ncbi:hypothetical protein [Tsukamurella soli]|uniref:DUF3761 domain-containing protein n=1 Tax=Tsukamurella soli TaxID=644556 RepID=A0ABP8JX01_9ACTN